MNQTRHLKLFLHSNLEFLCRPCVWVVLLCYLWFPNFPVTKFLSPHSVHVSPSLPLCFSLLFVFVSTEHSEQCSGRVEGIFSWKYRVKIWRQQHIRWWSWKYPAPKCHQRFESAVLGCNLEIFYISNTIKVDYVLPILSSILLLEF